MLFKISFKYCVLYEAKIEVFIFYDCYIYMYFIHIPLGFYASFIFIKKKIE